ncbi:MAG: SAM-dependent methyltransferase [Gammaproteobacteria bacterium]|nr:MAG: SAM-dependent methyltransferase [Gammaproteobacteria bacterium]
MWDERYDTEHYIYGTTANTFLADNVNAIPKGNVLSIAEGEGRNAVFLAKQGYNVTAVEGSLVGIEKAKKLAKQHNVSIEFIHADLADYDFGENKWDAVISIFCPLASTLRKTVHQKIVKALKKKGVLLLEAYNPEQLNYGTGGGDSADLMMTQKLVSFEFSSLTFSHLTELEREVIEGTHHTGLAAVVQAIAYK